MKLPIYSVKVWPVLVSEYHGLHTQTRKTPSEWAALEVCCEEPWRRSRAHEHGATQQSAAGTSLQLQKAHDQAGRKEQWLPDQAYELPPLMGHTLLRRWMQQQWGFRDQGTLWWQVFDYRDQSKQAAHLVQGAETCSSVFLILSNAIPTQTGILYTPSWFIWYLPYTIAQNTIYTSKCNVIIAFFAH